MNMQAEGHESASERAYRELRRAIVEGRLPVDRKLTELGLAERLGFSRTPVREAIKRLLLEGLLERRKGQGLWCVLPDPDEADEIFDLRLRLESYAAARAAKCATDAQIQALLRSARRMEALAATMPATDDLIIRISEENALFHDLIIKAALSQRLIYLVKMTVDIALVSRTVGRYTLQQRKRSASHHSEIAAAIAARKPRWAEYAMRLHILSAADNLGTAPPSPED